jgi:hypothetical protein
MYCLAVIKTWIQKVFEDEADLDEGVVSLWVSSTLWLRESTEIIVLAVKV